MEDRTRRIVESAIALARVGGFDGVRIRDIAARAEVALGTLYKRFSSKEDILIAAIEHELSRMEREVRGAAFAQPTYGARATALFGALTQTFATHERLARAALKALTAADRTLSERVLAFHARIDALVADALASDGRPSEEARALDAEELRALVRTLSQVWFAALIGWTGGLQSIASVSEEVGTAARWIVKGMLA